MKIAKLLLRLLAVICATCFARLQAQTVAAVSQALPLAVENKVELIAAPSSTGTADKSTKTAGAPAAITAGGTIRTGAKGGAAVILSGAGTVLMDRDTEIQIPATPSEHSLELLKGRLFLQINAKQLQQRNTGEFRLKTPAALLAVKGTRFFVDCEKNGDVIGLHEGSVLVSEPTSQSATTLVPSQAVSVSGGKVSPPRPLSAKEKGAARSYEDITLTYTPLALAAGPDSTPQLFDQGWLSSPPNEVLTEGEYLRFYHFTYYFNRALDHASTLSVTDSTRFVISPSGEAQASCSYAYTVVTEGIKKKDRLPVLGDVHFLSSMPLYLKGEAWRAKHSGLPKIGALFGIQLHLRFKNVAKAFCTTQGNLTGISPEETIPPGTVVLEAPAALPQAGSWEQDCVVPVPLSKSGVNRTMLYLLIYPAGPFDAAGNLRHDTAEVTITDCVMVSHAK